MSLIRFLRKDFVVCPILSGNSSIENAVGAHLYLLSLPEKSSAALMDNFLYMHLACYLKHLWLFAGRFFLGHKYLFGLWVARNGRTRITALRANFNQLGAGFSGYTTQPEKVEKFHVPGKSQLLMEKFQGMYYTVSLRVYRGIYSQ